LRKRIANVLVLAEDDEQVNLVRRYFGRLGKQNPRVFAPADGGRSGSGEAFVRANFAARVRDIQASLGRKTGAYLIVVVDADTETTKHRRDQLFDALESANVAPIMSDEPIALMIPKRNIETWIRALCGCPVNEMTDYSRPAVGSDEIKCAVLSLFNVTRPNAPPPDQTWPPSLTDSIPEWRKIERP
jgi:hypothetical protein